MEICNKHYFVSVFFVNMYDIIVVGGSMIKYIVFDVDRTIVDSFEPELLSFGEAMKNVTGISITKEQSNMFISMPTKEFLKKLNISDEQINEIKKEWGNTFPKYKVTCFPGIKETIKELNKMGYIMGLVTSRTVFEFHELDEELSDIIDLFKVIVTSDKVSIPKPNRASMDYLWNELNCTSDEVLYVGDSYIDKEFALNSLCPFIPACYDNKELIKEENACLNPKNLLSIIKRVESDNNEIS